MSIHVAAYSVYTAYIMKRLCKTSITIKPAEKVTNKVAMERLLSMNFSQNEYMIKHENW